MVELTIEFPRTLGQYNNNVTLSSDILTGREFRTKRRIMFKKPRIKNKNL